VRVLIFSTTFIPNKLRNTERDVIKNVLNITHQLIHLQYNNYCIVSELVGYNIVIIY